MPYRRTEPLRTWTLRTSVGWYVVGIVAVTVAIAAPLWFFLSMPYFDVRSIGQFWFIILPGLALVAVYVFGGEGYRVHGGRAEMRLYPDRLEIPRKRKPGVDVLPLDELRLGVTTFRTRVNFVPVSEVMVLSLVAGPIDRKISERLVESRRALERIIEDIDRVQRGEPPRAEGDDGAPMAGEGARGVSTDDLDARIDAELAKLD